LALVIFVASLCTNLNFYNKYTELGFGCHWKD